MTLVEIHQQLTSIFRDVFDEPLLEITDATTAADVEEWDSLAHIRLIVEVEKQFSIVLTIKDVKALTNVGDFMLLIARKVA
jgi:acyl carrier protein